MKFLSGLERPPRFRWQDFGVAPAPMGVLPVTNCNCRARRNLRILVKFRSPRR